MSLVPLVALIVFLLPFLIAHAVRASLSAATARRIGRVFDATSWVAGAGCGALGLYCLYSMSHSLAPWNQLGLLGLMGFVMLGSLVWTSFHLGYRVLVPANRFTRFAGMTVNVQGWPSV
ncbi:hypothetical protein [Devosia sp. CN2-171]|jgi:hypothetical protein|uniref:hypothetical protein n=1 Tax=Devosia sp. CN2-171 TaxID=3400909 RepID=UPI003BF8069B